MIYDTLIQEVMTKDVIALHPEDPMTKVQEIFESQTIHHIPVIDDEGKVVGIISSQDYHKLQNTFTFFRTSRSKEYNEAIMKSMLVKEVMTDQLAVLHPGDTLRKAATYFKENRFHALPIVNEARTLVGILTTFDMINYAYNAGVTSDL